MLGAWEESLEVVHGGRVRKNFPILLILLTLRFDYLPPILARKAVPFEVSGDVTLIIAQPLCV